MGWASRYKAAQPKTPTPLEKLMAEERERRAALPVETLRAIDQGRPPASTRRRRVLGTSSLAAVMALIAASDVSDIERRVLHNYGALEPPLLLLPKDAKEYQERPKFRPQRKRKR